MLFVLSYGLLCNILATTRAAPAAKMMASGVSYLEQYGYLKPQDMRTGQLRSQNSLEEAIANFQMMANITVTGKINAQTVRMMMMPRCGVADKIGSGYRNKRYALQGSKWRSKDLTYRIQNKAADLDSNTVNIEIKRAFKVWSDVAPLRFREVHKGKVDIDISFVKRDHGDGNPFDGEGRVLAHAYFPQYGGDTHFDDDERWTRETTGGVNLFMVAAHEFGHSLGLSHSDVKTALMSPFYKGISSDFKLHVDDVGAVTELYGRRTTGSVTKPPRRTYGTESPVVTGKNICQNPKIDAATVTNSGYVYVFTGKYYYQLMDYGIAKGFPRMISTDWRGVTGPVDAVVSWRNGLTFIFKGDSYWKFSGQRSYSGYPRKISSGFGMPSNLDAVFQWGANGKTYFTKGSNYRIYSKYTYNGRHTRRMYAWRGVPSDLSAAFRYKNGRTYFFKGRNYYRYDDKNRRIDKGYPRDIGKWWFGCSKTSQIKQGGENGKDQYSKPLLPDFVWHKRTNKTNPDTTTGSGAVNSRIIGPSILTFISTTVLFTTYKLLT